MSSLPHRESRTRTALGRCLSIPFLLSAATALCAQEKPYFVAYDHQMEEPGNLEVAASPVFGLPKMGRRFVGTSFEFEYGVKAWWTAELYLDGQHTSNDSTIFTGFRWENRFRPLRGEHWINPVLYVEFENLSDADRSLLEVVGFDAGRGPVDPNALARREHLHELETKLILGSNWRGWNFSENFIAEKNLADEPWEFGYALGIAHPLALAATPRECTLCRENFRTGLEMYGGMGDAHRFTLSGTSHYLGPIVIWDLPQGVTLRVSSAWGLTGVSYRALIRFGISYEIENFGRRVKRLFHSENEGPDRVSDGT
jgi:hypothetical protein